VTADDPALDSEALDALWDFGDPAGSETRFRQRLSDMPPGSHAAEELRTQLARAMGLQGRFDEAAAQLDEVAATLGDDPGDLDDRPVLRARLDLERGRVLNSGGAPQDAVPLFRRALDGATAAGDDFLAADAAHMLAIADRDNADDWTRRGLAVVNASSHARTARWAGSLHNNLGWSLHDAGKFDEALDEFHGALDAYRAAGTDEQVRVARWAIARCLRSLRRYDEALTIQTELSEGPSDGYVDEEIGELLLATGRGAEARPHFAVAAEKLGADEWLVSHEAERLERLRILGGLDQQ
jgi:tetratricopeptide (TPR) repeat protein